MGASGMYEQVSVTEEEGAHSNPKEVVMKELDGETALDLTEEESQTETLVKQTVAEATAIVRLGRQSTN